MSISEFLEEITAEGVLTEAARVLIFSQKNQLESLLQRRHTKQLECLEIDYDLIEVTDSVYIPFQCMKFLQMFDVARNSRTYLLFDTFGIFHF